MVEILELFSTIWNFLLAFFSNCVVYMTAFPLLIDDFVKWCSPKASAWLDRKLFGERRRKAEKVLIWGGFFIASFMAFDGEHEARIKAESDNQTLAKQMAALSPTGQEEQIKSLKNTLESQRTAFSEMSVKQQQEIESLRKAANPLIAPIVSASADIEILYAIDPKQPAGGTNMVGGAQIAFGLGGNSLLMASSGSFLKVYTNGDGVEHVTVTCPTIAVPQSPYLGKPVSSLRDAKFIQIDTSAIDKTTSILGGTVRWEINGVVPINYTIPAGAQDQGHIMIHNLSEGVKQLSSTPDKP